MFSIQASYFATSWKVPVTGIRAEALHKGCQCSYADVVGRPTKLSLGKLHGQAGSRIFVDQLSLPTDPSVGSFAVVSGPLPSREELPLPFGIGIMPCACRMLTEQHLVPAATLRAGYLGDVWQDLATLHLLA